MITQGQNNQNMIQNGGQYRNGQSPVAYNHNNQMAPPRPANGPVMMATNPNNQQMMRNQPMGGGQMAPYDAYPEKRQPSYAPTSVDQGYMRPQTVKYMPETRIECKPHYLKSWWCLLRWAELCIGLAVMFLMTMTCGPNACVVYMSDFGRVAEATRPKSLM